MRRNLEMLGKKFGRLLVVAEAGKKSDVFYWRCICDCGRTTTSNGSSLRAGRTLSCGCARADGNRRHGLTGTPIYNVWLNMKARCYRKSNEAYKNYGGRGIVVCDRWRNSFEAFFSDMGDVPAKGYEIDRIDNNGNYEPDNCKWATVVEQSKNRRTNIKISFNGKEQCVTDWAREIGIGTCVLHQRLFRYKWSIERALTEPATPGGWGARRKASPPSGLTA